MEEEGTNRYFFVISFFFLGEGRAAKHGNTINGSGFLNLLGNTLFRRIRKARQAKRVGV